MRSRTAKKRGCDAAIDGLGVGAAEHCGAELREIGVHPCHKSVLRLTDAAGEDRAAQKEALQPVAKKRW